VRKVTIHYVLFIVMLVLGLFQIFSGFIMWFVLPRGGLGRGAGGSGDVTFWALSRHNWADLHDWVAVVLVVVVIVHFILHWKWIVRMTRSYLGGAS
jgi:hypothetical protein